jgi:hypothetical protein
MPDIKVLAHKNCTATFAVPSGTRKEIEKAIEETLRSDKELVWQDDLKGIKVDCIGIDETWKPQRRFFPKNGED